MIGIIYSLSYTVHLLNTIEYYWSNTSTLLCHLPKNSIYLLLRLRCSIDFLSWVNLANPLINTAKSSVQESESRLFNIEESHKPGKLRYLDASISVCVCVFWSKDQDRMPELWGGEDWNSSAPTWFPTLGSGQPIPRLWVPNAHYLSLTRRISMPMTRDEWYEYNRQLEKYIQAGYQRINRMGVLVASRVRLGT